MAKTTTGTPFPWLPMLAIAVGLLSHFYALTSLFPYAGYMVQSLGVTTDKDEAGQSLLGYPLCSVRLLCIYLSTLRLRLQRKERGKGKDGAQLGRRASASSNHGSTRVPPLCLCAPSYILICLMKTCIPPLPTGYYAGYIASAFMVGRVGGSYFWGRFADQYGRLPVFYIGLGSMAVLSIAFGLSTTFAWAVGCR